MYSDIITKAGEVLAVKFPDATIQDGTVKFNAPDGATGVVEFMHDGVMHMIEFAVEGDNIVMEDVVMPMTMTEEKSTESTEAVVEEVSETNGDATPSNLENVESARMYSQEDIDQIKADYEKVISNMKASMASTTEAQENEKNTDADTEQASELENAKSADSDDFNNLVNKFGYRAALKIKQGLIVL